MTTPDEMCSLVERLRSEMRSLWERGQRAAVEDFLPRHPELQSVPDFLLDFIYCEVCIREAHGETPCAEEYLSRFPQLAEPIQVLFQAHAALAAVSLAATGTTEAYASSTAGGGGRRRGGAERSRGIALAVPRAPRARQRRHGADTRRARNGLWARGRP